MIPKVIHYFWFGGNPLPPIVEKCIDSWKKFMPEYEIKRWDESNFDIHQSPYMEEAYKAKKWAYVSDYARIKILYEEGGVYLDTDVELIKDLNILIDNGPFMACEIHSNLPPYPPVNLGLGAAIPPHHFIFKAILDYYNTLKFVKVDGGLTIVEHVTNVLIQYGLKPTLEIQKVGDITIYPKEYFCPYDKKRRLAISDNTVAIHHSLGTWLDSKSKLKKRIVKVIGPNLTYFIVVIKKHLNNLLNKSSNSTK